MARNILITGASAGIGLETARAFAKYGDNLYLCARRLAKLTELQKELRAAYPNIKVEVFQLDVSRRQETEDLLGRLLAKAGTIDVLVNNAGLAQGLDKYQESSLDDVERMIDTNIKGLLYVTRLVLPVMLKAGRGQIINLGSTAGIYAYAGGAVYCATKSAVKTLSDGIRIDTIDTDIKVTNIQPGLVETGFSEVRFHGDKKRAAEVYAGVKALKPEDIADIILYTANQPYQVQITDVTVMATRQATGFMIARD